MGGGGGCGADGCGADIGGDSGGGPDDPEDDDPLLDKKLTLPLYEPPPNDRTKSSGSVTNLRI